MQLSVIILNYKVPYFLLQCLESVTKSIQHLDAEIIVVDNHSEDESCVLVKKHFPEVKLIARNSNDGFSKGNNIGVAQAKGKFICLLNPDTVVGENTFPNLIQFAGEHPDFGIIGTKLFDGCGHYLPESKRNIPTPKVALQKLLNKSEAYYSSLHENENGKVAILVGAFMLMHKDRYLEVGKLDEDYFMYGEDIDLSYKFLQAGYQNYYVGQEFVLHYKGESTARDKVYRQRFYGAMKIFYQKHFQKNRSSRLFVNLGLRLAKAAHSIRREEKPVLNTQKYYFWIGQENEFIKKVEQNFKTPIQLITPQKLKNTDIADAVLIFDAGEISYTQILEWMQQLNSNNNQFFIKPSQFHFMICSDSNITKGEVIEIN